MSAATPPSTPVGTEFLSNTLGGAKNSPPSKQKQKSLSGKGQKISRQKHIQLDEDRQSQSSLDKMFKGGKATNRDSPPMMVVKPLISILTPKTYTSHTLPRRVDTPPKQKLNPLGKKKSSGKSKNQNQQPTEVDESTVSLMTSSPGGTPPPSQQQSPVPISTSLHVSTSLSRKSSSSNVRFDDKKQPIMDKNNMLVVVASSLNAVGDKPSMASSMNTSSETGLTSLNMLDTTNSSINLNDTTNTANSSQQVSPHSGHADDSGILAQNSPISPCNILDYYQNHNKKLQAHF